LLAVGPYHLASPLNPWEFDGSHFENAKYALEAAMFALGAKPISKSQNYLNLNRASAGHPIQKSQN